MMIRVEVDGNYITSLDEKGKRIKRFYTKGLFLGNSSELAIVQEGNYLQVYNEVFNKISRIHLKIDRFLSVSGDTFSVQIGNYAETYDKKGKRLSRKYSK
jgi:hypothetical protein